MLSVLSQSESALQRMHEELQVSRLKRKLSYNDTDVFISVMCVSEDGADGPTAY